MKIVWFSHVGNLAGASFCMLEATQALITLGHEVHVVVPDKGSLVPRVEEVGATVSVVPMAWWVHWPQHGLGPNAVLRRAARHLLSLPALLLLLRRLRPDVAVTNSIAIPIGAVAARLSRVPHVWYVHEFGEEDHGLIFDLGTRRSIGLMDSLSSQIMVNSFAVKRKFEKYVSSDKLHSLYYSVETPLSHDAAERDTGDLALLLVGQVAPSKGQEEAIRALACIGSLGVAARLRLVGGDDFDYWPHLETLARELGVSERVEFLGVRSPFPHYARADIVLMCSRSEAFGRVTVEAMKMGRPVIGANRGATPELIRDGQTGLLYRQGDPRDLADKVLQLQDPAQRQALGRAAQLWASDQFNSARYGEDLSRILRETIGG